ncbi:MAG: DUF192 domain-containing protein [Anaerolineales bacterium]
MRQVSILNNTHPLRTPLTAGYCDRFLCRLRGLMLRSQLPTDRGLVLVENAESRLNAGIHMLGMAFDLGIVWLDNNRQVVDIQKARRWRSFLIPRIAARYVIEFHAKRLEEFHLGDQIVFEETHPA